MPHPVLTNGGTSAEWAIENPILPAGTTGTETDTGKTKLGNGTSYWNSLKYTDEPSGPDILALAVSNALMDSDKDFNVGIDSSHNWGEQTAAEAGEGLYYFQNVGKNGFVAYSNGTDFIPVSDIFIMTYKDQLIVASLAAANAATWSQSGTIITVDNGVAHNIPITGYNGAIIYLPLSISVGIQPTSEVDNFYTDLQVTSSTAFTCVATNSQTASGNVLSNNSATALLPMQKTISAGTLEIGDCMVYQGSVSNNNSAGAKQLRQTVNSVSCILASYTTTPVSQISQTTILSIIKTDRVLTSNGSTSLLNFITNSYVYVPTITIANSNDYMCVEQLSTRILKRGF